jgi:hypothetical protein
MIETPSQVKIVIEYNQINIPPVQEEGENVIKDQ